jgi:hypothetical protein
MRLDDGVLFELHPTGSAQGTAHHLW